MDSRGQICASVCVLRLCVYACVHSCVMPGDERVRGGPAGYAGLEVRWPKGPSQGLQTSAGGLCESSSIAAG